MVRINNSERADLLAMIEMSRDAIRTCEAEGDDALVEMHRGLIAKREAALAALPLGGGEYSIEVEGEKRALTDRPAAGSAASNQFGTFQVKYASPAQTRFIKSLLERKDLTKAMTATTLQRPLDVDALRAQVAANQVNKKAASDIIDRLLACDDKAAPAATPGAPAKVTRPASEKQVGLIGRLAAERFWFDGASMETAVTHESHAGWTVRQVLEGTPVESRAASAAIDFLFGCAKAATRTPAAPLEAGMYRIADGTLVRVYYGRQSGQMLAKKVVGSDDEGYSFEYLGKADRFVKVDQRLTLDEAKAWGRMTGTCCVCAAHLDDPTSVEAGIGPVCATRV